MASTITLLWGHIKTSIYGATRFENLNTLRQAVENCSINISHQQLRNVQQEFERRLEYCIAAEGQLFAFVINL